MRQRLLALVLAVLGFGPTGFLAAAEPAPPLRVLFIGNSLTYTNDLPGVFEALAVAAGKPKPVVRWVTIGGFSLEDQWNRGDARKAVASGPWDFVVLQQGPSASAEGSSSLRAYTRWFAREIRAGGATPALYQVWPSTSRPQDFDGVIRSYADAAREVDGVLLPAGEAWRAAWKRDPGLELYSKDGLHPTLAGTYLAALTVFGRLYGASPVGLPSKLTLSSGAEVEVPKAQARTMQEAAQEVDTKAGSTAAASPALRTPPPR